jgi:hypothetical protein
MVRTLDAGMDETGSLSAVQQLLGREIRKQQLQLPVTALANQEDHKS